MRQNESRLLQAEKRAGTKRKGSLYKCYRSDGKILHLDAWEIMKYYNSLDDDFYVMEPYIYKVECMDDTERQKAAKLCSVVEQTVESMAAKASRGEIHRP